MTGDRGSSAWAAADEAVTDWLGKAGSCLQVRTRMAEECSFFARTRQQTGAPGTTPKPRSQGMPEQTSQTQYGPLVARAALGRCPRKVKI